MIKHSPSTAARHGFTLVEIMIVVVIIGLLAAMGVPAFQKVRKKSIATRVVNDLNDIAEEFSLMLFVNPALPTGIYNEGGIGGVPAGFEAVDLPKNILLRPINPNSAFSIDLRSGLADANQAVVVLTQIGGVLDQSILIQIDQIMDDGDLTTGEVQLVNPGQLIYSFYTE